MTAKKLNFIIGFFLIVIAGFFAISTYVKNTKLSTQDASHQQQLDEALKEYNEKIGEYLTVSQENDKDNTNGEFNENVTNNPNSGANSKQDFKNFFEMYTFALNKFNNATNVYSEARGYSMTDGSSAIIKFNNKKFFINYVRARNIGSMFFDFSFRGKAIEGIPEILMESQLFSDYKKYCYYYPLLGGQKTTKLGFENSFKWNMKDLFHIINEDTVTKVNSFFYDKYNKVYKAKIVLDPVLANTNFGSTVQHLTASDEPASFTKTELEIIVDEYGLFKSIAYVEDFKLMAKIDGVEVRASCRTTFTETFVIIDNGSVEIKEPSFALK